ncbi:hypothetical protein MYCTH_2298511 [Thermothelomyces thermophilus ATCC 42464]|uniref:C2H2-type domain-containing protein n=1 Tax=Thermothelomyces thermophilus (strain ATCC 42464 / BCRC 31852 / DSM 1799) TaxID=573729 RepID=G2Q2G0_THET4|nr:uncharacterized protein MYCTH_2298511 [Thermothelomyces thermophilus ATCC 42464]AEO55085.1 hypothetical protein MYCTH_2298511 [Thermothelomyces thermophilus ATCC 42464]
MDGAAQGETREQQEAAPAAAPPPPSPTREPRERDPDSPGTVASDAAREPAALPKAATSAASPLASAAAVDDGATPQARPADPATITDTAPASPSLGLRTGGEAPSDEQPSAGQSMPPSSNPPAASPSQAGQGQNQAANREALRWTDPITITADGPGTAQSSQRAKSPQRPLEHAQQQPLGPPLPPPPQLQQQQHHLQQPQHLPVPAPPPPAPSFQQEPGSGLQQQSRPRSRSPPQLLPRAQPHQYPQHDARLHSHASPAPAPSQSQSHIQQSAPPYPQAQAHAQMQIAPQHQQSHHQQLQEQQHHHPPHHHQPPLLPPPSSAPVTPSTPSSQQRSHSLHEVNRAIISKPVIMDPPTARKQAQPQYHAGAMGFPSPTRDYATVNPKFLDDFTRIKFAIQQSVPEAVRRVVRDHWEKCLLGSEFHQAFILNASIHHATPSITQRAVRDFGGKMVAESKHEIIGHFTTEALDEVADLIISKASDSFLDKCLAKRLLTIEAKPLINALAAAERLGYEPGDIVEDEKLERAMPQEAYPGATAAANGHLAGPAQAHPLYPQPGQAQLQCTKCFRTFVHTSAFDYHTRHDVCSQIPPTTNGFEHSCPHCGQGFTNIVELQGHLHHQVCGNPEQPQPARRGRKPKSSLVFQASPPPVTTPSGARPAPANGTPRTLQQSTPTHFSLARPAASTPGSAGSGIAADPYAHLSERQIRLMNEELKAAEEKYAPRFAEANLIADENLRRLRIEGLRNSFGTKQSMIRKKFGVRLRERRTKAEILAERERLGLKKAEKEKERELARAAASGAQQPHTSSPSPNADSASRPAGSSGWTAANTPRANAAWDEHDAKRRRTDDGGGYQSPYKSLADETPTRKTQSGSLAAGGSSSAPASAQNSTALAASQPTRVYEQSGARVEIHEPSKTDKPTNGPSAAGQAPESTTPNGSDRAASNGRDAGSITTRAPSSENQPVVIDDVSSSDDDDDEDIPSTLPTHVRKSLASKSTTSPRRQTP